MKEDITKRIYKLNGELKVRQESINKQLRLEQKAEVKFTELNDAMREYHEVFGHKLPPLP